MFIYFQTLEKYQISVDFDFYVFLICNEGKKKSTKSLHVARHIWKQDISIVVVPNTHKNFPIIASSR